MQATKTIESSAPIYDPQHELHRHAYNKIRKPQSKERNERAARALMALVVAAGIYEASIRLPGLMRPSTNKHTQIEKRPVNFTPDAVQDVVVTTKSADYSKK